MKTKVFSIFLMAIQLWLLVGCVQNDVVSDLRTDPENDSHSLIELYKDSSFLKIEGDLNDPENIWNNINVYSAACERMHRCLKFEKNKILWNIDNSQDLKISQNIYDYIIEAWNYDNNLIQDTNYVLVEMGIYYKIEQKNRINNPRTKTAQVLLRGDRDWNMRICCDIIRNQPTGLLNNYINLYESEGWREDGFSGLVIRDEWNINYFNIVSYYVSIYPFEIESPYNEIATYHNNYDGIESACNVQHAPLVTTKGRYFWEKDNGIRRH